MKVGTKSLLFGVHQFAIHPFFVAKGWIENYGWPRNWRIWVAFVVHDWGYWGCADMDGDDGERHVERGAKIMHVLFDPSCFDSTRPLTMYEASRWQRFMLFHSRFYAKKYGENISRLCVADKACTYLYPRWLYLFLGRLSGEVNEYFARSLNGKYTVEQKRPENIDEWYDNLCIYMRNWVMNWKDVARDDV